MRGRTGKSFIVLNKILLSIKYGINFSLLYFAENNGDGLIKARANIYSVFNSKMMTKEESIALVSANQHKLHLNSSLLKRFSGKRYIVLIEVSMFEMLEPFKFDRSEYGNILYK